jgi:hypothetical protein
VEISDCQSMSTKHRALDEAHGSSLNDDMNQQANVPGCELPNFVRDIEEDLEGVGGSHGTP